MVKLVPLQLEVPTLAWDAQSIVLVWHKPDSSADVVDYRVYMDCQLLGSAAVNNTQVSPAKSHIDGFYAADTEQFHVRATIHNFTVAGLEQSKFIPAASGLIGFEFQPSFQLGVGVNLTPDPAAPSHMIAAAGWTPSVGDIQTPVHFFIVPDTEGNHRMGATRGMSW